MAGEIGSSAGTVGEVRKELEERHDIPEATERVGADGKTRKSRQAKEVVKEPQGDVDNDPAPPMPSTNVSTNVSFETLPPHFADSTKYLVLPKPGTPVPDSCRAIESK